MRIRLRTAGAIFFPATSFVAGAASFVALVCYALAVITAATTVPAHAEPISEEYMLIERFADRARLPRLLTTDDLGIAQTVPTEIPSLFGDLDGDGRVDLALSGVYNLPNGPLRYFMLVASDIRGRPRLLFQQDGTRPFFLHAPGSTGNGDPGDQAFSVSSCVNCGTGTDFRWDPRAHRFRQIPWAADRLVTRRAEGPEAPPSVPNLPEEAVDKALRIAGALPDVRAYVAGLNKNGRKLGTRVEPVKGSTETVRVLVFEKAAGGEKMFEAIEIDLPSGRVLGRKKG
jgi:hypothetical protein